jgi:hypothetical protein
MAITGFMQFDENYSAKYSYEPLRLIGGAVLVHFVFVICGECGFA